MALGKNRDAFSLNCSCINTSPRDFCGLKRLDCSAGSGSWWVKLFFPGHCCFPSAGLRSEGSLKEPWGRNVCSQKRNSMVAVPFSWFVFMFLTWAVWYLCSGFSSPLSGCPLHSSVFGCLQLGFQCSAVGRPGRNFQQVVSNYLFSPFFFFFFPWEVNEEFWWQGICVIQFKMATHGPWELVLVRVQWMLSTSSC